MGSESGLAGLLRGARPQARIWLKSLKVILPVPWVSAWLTKLSTSYREHSTPSDSKTLRISLADSFPSPSRSKSENAYLRVSCRSEVEPECARNTGTNSSNSSTPFPFSSKCATKALISSRNACSPSCSITWQISSTVSTPSLSESNESKASFSS